MRNLKKVLSLTLALVMMLGMMTFAGAAETAKITSKDLTDMKDVVNKEAVTLLVDLGVINGIKQADGTYKYAPKDTINRGSYAKMVYAVMMASNNADVYKGVNTGLKDVAGHWAEGFIGYCVTTKLAVGNGNGTFTPNANITTVAASKMLLVALGYDAKASGYEGDDLWSINIMRDAQKAGLLNGVNQKASENLSRDNAAQLIYNALFANTVVPNYQYDMGVKYLTKYDYNATTLGGENFDLVKVTGVVESTANGELTLALVGGTPVDPLDVLRTGINGKKIPVANDMVGKKVVVYVKATLDSSKNYVFDSVYSSVAIAGTSVVLGTSTNGTPIRLATVAGGTGKDLTTKLSANKGFIAELDVNGSKVFTGTAYLNGGQKTASDKDTETDYVAGNGIHDDVEVAADIPGAIVELIDADGNGKADMIKVVKQSMATLTADPSTKTVNDVLQVKVPGVPALGSLMDAAKVVGYEGLKKDDVVLYYKDVTTGVYTLEKAASIEGKVEATKTGEIRIGGTFYGASGLTTFDIDSVKDSTDTYTFYLDNGKNIIKADAITSTASKDYAVIVDAKFVKGTTIDTGDYAQAKLLFADGTTQIVTVSKVDGLKIGATNMKEADVNHLKPGSADGKNFDFYTYVVDANGKYEITKAAGDKDILGTTVTNGAVLFDTKTVGNANTVFLVATTVDDVVTYKMYKGIAAVPTITVKTSAAAGSTMVTKDGIATYVFLNADTVTGTTSDAIYFYVTDHTDAISYPKNGTVPAYTEVPVYINGEVVKAKFATANKPTENDLYKVTTINDAGHYTAIAKVDVATTKVNAAKAQFVKGVNVVSGGTLSVGTYSTTDANNTLLTFTYDANTKAYFIDKSGVMSAVAVADIAVDPSNVVLVLATGTVADVVYVKEVLSTVATATTQAVATTGGVKVVADNIAAVTWGSEAGTAAGTAKTTTQKVVVAGDDIAKAFTYTIVATDPEATITLLEGTVPGTGAAVGPITLKYMITAESGAQMWYTVTLTIAAS